MEVAKAIVWVPDSNLVTQMWCEATLSLPWRSRRSHISTRDLMHAPDFLVVVLGSSLDFHPHCVFVMFVMIPLHAFAMLVMATVP